MVKRAAHNSNHKTVTSFEDLMVLVQQENSEKCQFFNFGGKIDKETVVIYCPPYLKVTIADTTGK